MAAENEATLELEAGSNFEWNPLPPAWLPRKADEGYEIVTCPIRDSKISYEHFGKIHGWLNFYYVTDPKTQEHLLKCSWETGEVEKFKPNNPNGYWFIQSSNWFRAWNLPNADLIDTLTLTENIMKLE